MNNPIRVRRAFAIPDPDIQQPNVDAIIVEPGVNGRKTCLLLVYGQEFKKRFDPRFPEDQVLRSETAYTSSLEVLIWLVHEFQEVSLSGSVLGLPEINDFFWACCVR